MARPITPTLRDEKRIKERMRVMAQQGASEDQQVAFVEDQLRQLQGTSPKKPGGPVFTLKERLPQHPERLGSQQTGPEFALPLAKLREQEQLLLKAPPHLGRNVPAIASGLGAVGVSLAGPPGLAAQIGLSSFGAGAGQIIGDVLREKSRGNDVGSLTDMLEIGGEGAGAAAKNALFVGALGGAAKLFGFFRGAGPTATQQKGIEFAKNAPKVSGFKLPAIPEAFAERTAGAFMKRILNKTVLGSQQLRQQGMKVARFIEEEALALSGAPWKNIDDAVQAVSNSLKRIVTSSASESMQRFARGVGEKAGFENPGIFIEQLFTKTNIPLLKSLKRNDPKAFDDALSAFMQRGMNEARELDVSGQGHILFEGNKFRTFFEQRASVLKEVIPPETLQAWDSFTAYVAFASAHAKLPFQSGSKASDLMVQGAELAAPITAATFAGPFGVAGVGAGEAIIGAMSWALSKPGTGVYELFTQGVGQTAKQAGTAALRAGQFGIQAGPGFRTPGSPQPQRLPKQSDPRFTPPFP